MKPRRFFFRSPQIFGAPIRVGVPLALGFSFLLSGLGADAGDILRGGASSSRGGRGKGGGANIDAPTPAAADAARANARDTLARTTRTLQAMKAMQKAARNAANKGANNLGKHPNNPGLTLPNVPNGLGTNALQVSSAASTDPLKWVGAKLPKQTKAKGRTKVTIKQTEQNALLNWDSFNVGRKTTLSFDQTKGGENAGQWIAFNQINDPAANPTQILGSIKADGQVYIINPNGVIFGGSSVVNARGLTVSTLPINTNLVSQGLLNNRDSQFLFSGLTVPGGSDGTGDFDPGPAPAGGYGDVIVKKGSILETPSDSAGNGGRVMLVGANVHNAGTISTPAGQTILAAGLQVATAAHVSSDPSLRGLDVWVGDVGDYAGSVVNHGIIETLLGSATLTGSNIEQRGAIESSTSVVLNGRIDLLANYGAVANPNFDNSGEPGSGGPQFLFQSSGSVTLGEKSTTRILPDYLSDKTVPGTELPERSQINISGLALHFDRKSRVFAPNAEVSIRAGRWTYQDVDANRTIFDANGVAETGLENHFSGDVQKFLYDAGQIYVDRTAVISVAGSVDVFVPADHQLLDIELRGAELADSPLQRESNVRGVAMTVDLRKTGTYSGRFWQGTPLGDVTGLAGLIQRNAAQLTAEGGDITMRAGGSIVVRENATIDVSGGFYRNEGGDIATSKLISGGRLIPIEQAIPERSYDGVFNGRSQIVSEKWGIVRTFTNPLFSSASQPSYVEGAAGGTLSLTAPGMAIDGDLRGMTVRGNQQRSVPPEGSKVNISFTAETTVAVPGGTEVEHIDHSPTPPTITFARHGKQVEVPEFQLASGLPGALPQERLEQVVLDPDLLDEEGFGSISVSNPDGDIIVPGNVVVETQPGRSISFDAANITVLGTLRANSGSISLTTYNISPSFTAESNIVNPAGTVPFPTPVEGRGLLTLGAGGRIDASGLVSNDLPGSKGPRNEPISTVGGAVSIRSFGTMLERGSRIDVSGGIHVSDRNSRSFGDGGSITIISSTDQGYPGITGGDLSLGARLLGYSGATGGSLSIQAGTVHVGSGGEGADLQLASDFFQTGGFSKYSIAGFGMRSDAAPAPGQFESYLPAIVIGGDAAIAPRAETLVARIDPENGSRIRLTHELLDKGLRNPVSVEFRALGIDDPATIDSYDLRGDLVMERDASISTHPGASVTLRGQTVTVRGSITAPGGAVNIVGASSFPFTSDQDAATLQALPTVHLSETARISAAGSFLRTPDEFGRRTGTISNGGDISIAGNIVAEKGAFLDVSGTSETFDLPVSEVTSETAVNKLPVSGLFTTPLATQGVRTKVDSDGGTISLAGSEMMLSDARLRGRAGGDSATAGTLSVSSKRFYSVLDGIVTSADTNLVVRQTGDVIDPASAVGVGIGLLDADGNAYGNMGTFALDRFHQGGFANLELGGNYDPTGLVPVGGNVHFEGDIKLIVPGALRLAAGGVVTGDGSIQIRAGYAAIGQGFRPPLNPNDAFLPFRQDPAVPSAAFNFAPTFGTGALDIRSRYIDIGTLSLQDIGSAELRAGDGEIRGNSTIHIAGDLKLRAGSIYPTSGSRFSLFAYDHSEGTGSITFESGGRNPIPFSNGGVLEAYATDIVQAGVLRAPGGRIILGWDGTDIDPSDADLDTPFDVIAGSTATVPVTSSVTLARGSITSVSTFSADHAKFRVPYGISPDGRSWIDPRGVNVSLNSLPQKRITIAGDDVNMESKARVDLRGGGDLLAFRWVAGNGGSTDILGAATETWDAGRDYEAGELVLFGGQTWSARVGHSGQTPNVSRYWTKVAESFAILPNHDLAHSPFNEFNTGANASLLAGEAGFVNNSLKAGDTVTLEKGAGVAAGTYTLLPSRYALLPGAFLVTPVSNDGIGTISLADGSKVVSGFVGNRFDARGNDPETRARFQVTPKPIIEDRAEYQRFLGNEFLARIAAESGSTDVQRLPDDAGSVRFQGNSALRLAGRLMTQAPGRGASADVSSFSDIHISAGSSSSGSPGTVVLSAAKLSDWKVESLLVGGVRNRLPDGTTTIDSRTSNIVVDNRGGALKAVDLNLVSDGSLTISDRASLVARGAEGFQGTSFALEGGGTFARISADPLATISRSSVTAGGAESLTIGGGARLKGPAVLLDSTSAMSLAPDIRLLTDSVSIASGAISIVAGDPTAAAGALGLQLEGLTLENIFQSNHVALRSYGAIDLYGSGVIGDSGLSSLTLSAVSIRGLDRSDGSFVIRAREILLDNKLASAASAASAAPAVSDGSLTLRANRITLGENDIAVTGFDVLGFRARDLLEGSGTGSLVTEGNLRVNAPLITGAAGADLSVTASGTMFLTSDVREISRTDSLGASLAFNAGSIVSDANFSLPSGDLTLTATRGDLDLGGSLSVDGTAKEFNKSIRFTHAGGIHLVSETGDVLLREGALVSASGDARGGNAGQIDISAANGAFRSSAEVSGTATKGFEQGSFRLDVKSVTDSGPGSLAALNAGLDKGGFTNSRAFRIREGDVAIDHLVTSHEFSLAADTGSILVTGRIDASGTTGGSISLSAHGDLVLAGGSSLTVRASEFDSAGKGGSILLEAGTQIDGVANESAVLALSSGSSIDLSVDDFVAGDYRTPGSSAFEGRFTGTLHLRAPRDAGNTDFGLASLDSAITGASSILAEGFKVYQPNNGVLNTSLRSQINNDNKSYLGSAGTLGANETAMRSRLLANNAGLDSILVLAPGVEIVNPSGDLTLGLANINGSTSSEARSTADWDLSSFRYGSMSAPGVLTMRASGDLVFNNTLSDGFDPVQTGFLLTATEAGNSSMWLATLSTIKDSLPVNTQSWSYRLTAGADTAASDFRAVRPEDELGGKGSVLVGELYPAVPNGNTSGTSAALGLNGLTSNTIRISTNSTDRGNRFEVIRTGTGSISVNAGRDIQLRNQFSTIYTAGVALPDPTRVFEADDFVIPIVPTSKRFHPGQSGPGGLNLGAIQQLYQPVWSMAGGNLDLHAGHDIGRFTMQNGTLVADSSRQMPTNWLYRRGYLDSSTGRFSNNAGIDGFPFSITDPAASTTWWIDYSNFFQGFGTLGGGNIDMSAGNDMVNADAVAPTNARMAGQRRNPAFGTTGQPEFLTLAPDAANLVELGGGDITVTSGRNIDGGIYYVERGHGTLDAGGSITTNAARTPSRGMLANEDPLDPLAWMPTTLFVGKSSFDVVAKQDALLGPVSNPFLLPQGQNNKYWYKTYFSTLAADAGATVSAYGGDVTHRNAIALPTGGGSVSMLSAWFDRQNLYTGAGSFLKSSNYQPWIRLAETGLGTFGEAFTLYAPNLDSTSFQGSVHLVGDITLAPSETGGLNLAAAGGIIGLNPTGPSIVNGTSIDIWTYSTVNVSDASPSSIPSVLNPLAYQSLIGRDQTTAVSSAADILGVVGNTLSETGSFTGDAATAVGKNLRHGDSILHSGDDKPITLDALGGDITGLRLFTPKETRIVAGRDISDVAFYLQNIDAKDLALVSAGRDIVPFSESSELRTAANNIEAGTLISNSASTTVTGTSTDARAGDIQINGPGVLEVLAGRNIDLGTGANFLDGTGTGITSIGNTRNLNLPFTGADLIVLGGISGATPGSPALGLSNSSLDFASFISNFIKNPDKLDLNYLKRIREAGNFENLDSEYQAVAALEEFFNLLRKEGEAASEDGDYSGGFELIKTLFGDSPPLGTLDLRSREIRTVTGGAITAAAAGGAVTMAPELFGNPLTPPGIVTEYGGEIGILTDGDVEIGQSRIFTLRGGDIVIWSSNGNIAAGSAPRTVVTAPPTRVLIDITSASVETDLGGLATGGGIGVLASVEGVEAGNVNLIAPNGFVDAGDAGIRATGNLNIAAQQVLNANNISVSGSTSGSAVAAPAAPSVSTATSASNTAAAAANSAPKQTGAQETPEQLEAEEQTPSVFTVTVIGYGGGGPADDEEEPGDAEETSEP